MRGKTPRRRVLLVLTAVVLAALVAGVLAYRGILLGVVPGRLAQAPKLPTIITGPVAQPLTGRIFPTEITVVDGDTISARGRTIRLVGFDAPETGTGARCARERELADRATAQLRSLIAGGNLELRAVPCACAPGTEGTPNCNFGRACAYLLAYGRDVGVIMVSYRLARPYICDTYSCPPRGSWC